MCRYRCSLQELNFSPFEHPRTLVWIGPHCIDCDIRIEEMEPSEPSVSEITIVVDDSESGDTTEDDEATDNSAEEGDEENTPPRAWIVDDLTSPLRPVSSPLQSY